MAVIFRSSVLWKFRLQPFQQFALVCRSGSPNLHEQFVQRWSVKRQIGSTFITNRTQSPQVTRIIRSTLRFVDHMSDLKPRFSRRIIGMRFASHRTTLLASEAIPIQDKRPRFFGYRTLKGWLGFCRIENVLARFQLTQIIVRQDQIPLFRPQLPHAPCPFTDVTRHKSQLVGVQLYSNVRKEVCA
jgi:hypothetical protein